MSHPLIEAQKLVLQALESNKKRRRLREGMADIIIVIPTYNEADNIKSLVVEVAAHMQNEDYMFYFIDDNSQDGTQDIMRELAKEYPIKVYGRAGKLGLGSAYIFGFKEAIKANPTYIMSMDADLSHQPKDVPRLLAKAREGFDIVLGSRYGKGHNGVPDDWGIARKIMSRGANFLAGTCLGIPARDLTGAFRCFRREVLATIDLDSIKSNGYAFLEEVLFLGKLEGYSFGEVPIMFMDRQYGHSKLNKIEILKFAIMIVRLSLVRLHNVFK